MTNYGLSKYQIKKANDKVLFNKEFMLNNGVQIDNKIIPFADFVSNSYTNSNRYIAELQHRAWSVYDYAKQKNLSNIFITLTLPSHWHSKKSFKGKLINNKKFGGRKYITTIENKFDNKKYKFLNAHISQNIPFVEPILDFSNTIDKYTPRNASKQLSKLLKKFFDDRSYKSIEKDDRCYFRVTEPHKDGTPHVHISLFVPEQNKNSIVKALNRLFPAPLSKIETDVNSPVAYLMKYVLKTLDDLRENNDKITNLTLWYLYHGISRFYTSRTFIALEVYRKLHGMYSLINLSKKYLNDDVQVYIHPDTKKIAFIENEYGTIYVQKPVNWLEKLDNADISGEEGTVQIDSGFESIYKDKPIPSIETIIDGEKFIYYNGHYKQVKKQPHEMGILELYEYFEDIDIETVDLAHYGYTKNLMIERGLHVGEWLKLTSYQDAANLFEEEVF